MILKSGWNDDSLIKAQEIDNRTTKHHGVVKKQRDYTHRANRAKITQDAMESYKCMMAGHKKERATNERGTFS